MALSNLNKDNLDRLFSMININHNQNNELVNSIKGDYSTFSKLELIAKQIQFLREEAKNVLANHEFNQELKSIECKFKKVPGNYYYCYYHNNKKIISLVSNTEGNMYDRFICKLYYDYDYNFYPVDNN
tara:strand:- start:2027 stop:2410 length:384 start_codon:yes stop_codon:yes gene_type:complete